ncbi:hypothetical protein LXL04_037450, partial [Taraxacum kok-saghyz]
MGLAATCPVLRLATNRLSSCQLQFCTLFKVCLLKDSTPCRINPVLLFHLCAVLFCVNGPTSMCGDGTANTTFPVTLCGLSVLFPRISVPYVPKLIFCDVFEGFKYPCFLSNQPLIKPPETLKHRLAHSDWNFFLSGPRSINKLCHDTTDLTMHRRVTKPFPEYLDPWFVRGISRRGKYDIRAATNDVIPNILIIRATPNIVIPTSPISLVLLVIDCGSSNIGASFKLADRLPTTLLLLIRFCLIPMLLTEAGLNSDPLLNLLPLTGLESLGV